ALRCASSRQHEPFGALSSPRILFGYAAVRAIRRALLTACAIRVRAGVVRLRSSVRVIAALHFGALRRAQRGRSARARSRVYDWVRAITAVCDRSGTEVTWRHVSSCVLHGAPRATARRCAEWFDARRRGGATLELRSQRAAVSENASPYTC